MCPVTYSSAGSSSAISALVRVVRRPRNTRQGFEDGLELGLGAVEPRVPVRRGSGVDDQGDGRDDEPHQREVRGVQKSGAIIFAHSILF